MEQLGNSQASGTSTTQRRICVDSSAKKFKLVEELLRSKELDVARDQSDLADDLNRYAHDKTRVDVSVDPIRYWVEKRGLMISPLPLFACSFLSVPASTAFVESVFSYAGLSSGKLRNKISGKNLEREVFLKVNKAFIAA